MIAERRLNRIVDPEDVAMSIISLTLGPRECAVGPDLVCNPAPDSSPMRLLWSLFYALGKRRECCHQREVSWETLRVWFEFEGIRRIFVLRGQTLRPAAIHQLNEMVGRHEPEIWLVDSAKKLTVDWYLDWGTTNWTIDQFERRQSEVLETRQRLKDDGQRRESAPRYPALDPLRKKASAFGLAREFDSDRKITQEHREDFVGTIDFLRGGHPEPKYHSNPTWPPQPDYAELLTRRTICSLILAESEDQKILRLKVAQLVAFQEGLHLGCSDLAALSTRRLASSDLEAIRRMGNAEDTFVGLMAMSLGLDLTDLCRAQLGETTNNPFMESWSAQVYGRSITPAGSILSRYLHLFHRWQEALSKDTPHLRSPDVNLLGSALFKPHDTSWHGALNHDFGEGRSSAAMLGSLERFESQTGIDPTAIPDQWADHLSVVMI